MADFADYELSPDLNVYDLADGILPEIAAAAGFELTPEPDEQNLGAFIGKVGPDKELQKNISVVREALGANATGQIADWVDRSGIMYPVERGFVHNTKASERAEAIIFTGGVARWMLRRTVHTIGLAPAEVIIPVGNREMKPTEHQLVERYQKRSGGTLPTEAKFARQYVTRILRAAGLSAKVIPVDSNKGDEIMDGLFAEDPDLLNRRLLVVSNAPNAIQATGELRLAGQRVYKSFDSTGEQVFMTQDSAPLARKGESPKTHQNPETAVGQLVRNGLYIERNRRS